MKLSVITICLNNIEGLRRTIASVVSQTWKDFEWIIVDGGSVDGSKELIEENQSLVSFWCSEPDKGIYHAMNKGAAKATGDYLLFMNAGDVFYDSSVLETVHAIGLRSDIVSGQAVRMDNGQLLRHYDQDIMMQLLNDTINHQATFIRRELFEEMRYDESLTLVSDWKFWLEALILRHCSYDVMDIRISKQDMTGISYSDQYKDRQNLERESVLEELFPQRVIDSLRNYSSFKKQPENRNMSYLKNKHPLVFRVFKKLISFVTIVSLKFSKDKYPADGRQLQY